MHLYNYDPQGDVKTDDCGLNLLPRSKKTVLHLNWQKTLTFLLFSVQKRHASQTVPYLHELVGGIRLILCRYMVWKNKIPLDNFPCHLSLLFYCKSGQQGEIVTPSYCSTFIHNIIYKYFLASPKN